MKTFYFIALDGFLQFVSVKGTCLENAIEQLTKAFAGVAPERLWVSVTEDEYVNLRNQECED